MTDLLIEMCQKYRALLNDVPNAWGQHVHATFGRSDFMLRSMYAEFGKATVIAELDKQYETGD